MINGYSNPESNIFIPSMISNFKPEIEPGLYETHKDMQYGYYFKKLNLEDKKIFEFEDNISDIILKDINKFWSLKSKYEKYKMPFGLIKQVFNRGMAAWKTGHRPGQSQEAWAHARVNSFVTKSSGTWGKADKDLAQKVRKK
jgi:hypothetical protein